MSAAGHAPGLPRDQFPSCPVNRSGGRRDPRAGARGASRKQEKTIMKSRIIASVIAAAGMALLAQPAAACPNGYESVWIQGNKVCKIKTPKLDLKANTGPELKKSATFKARTAPSRRAP
jgi:hypothetical protein